MTVVSVEHVTKTYRLGTIGGATLEHDLQRLWARIRGKPDPLTKIGAPPSGRREGETFWALSDVSFQVQRGEVLGIIGRNGAGKSTLLKILSQVTGPTTGQINVKGRIASLLEVGTGFHPELTGRENIFLNGAILGMTKAEIRRKLDEIIAFSEIEAFVDTPVKRYSSGMYVRLAFAVAAHLEPEILIVDEVLAVGDAQFQEKCIGKMQGVARQGRTILFVSHNMSAIQQLCTKAILLHQGSIQKSGEPAEVVGDYLSDSRPESVLDIRDWPDRSGTGEARLVKLTITDEDGHPQSFFPLGSTVCFVLEAEVHRPLLDPCIGVVVHTASGEPLLDLESVHSGLRLGRVQGKLQVKGTLRNIGLYPGRYLLTPWIIEGSGSRPIIDLVRLCSSIQVAPAPGPFGDLNLDPAWGKYWVPSLWEKVAAPAAATVDNALNH